PASSCTPGTAELLSPALWPPPPVRSGSRLRPGRPRSRCIAAYHFILSMTAGHASFCHSEEARSVDDPACSCRPIGQRCPGILHGSSGLRLTDRIPSTKPRRTPLPTTRTDRRPSTWRWRRDGAKMSEANVIGVGVVGCGGNGLRHAELYHSMKE